MTVVIVIDVTITVDILINDVITSDITMCIPIDSIITVVITSIDQQYKTIYRSGKNVESSEQYELKQDHGRGLYRQCDIKKVNQELKITYSLNTPRKLAVR